MLDELDFITNCDYGFDFLDDFQGLIKESVVEVGAGRESDVQQGGDFVEQLESLFDKLRNTLVSSAIPREAADAFFTAFVNRWMSDITDTLADVYFAYFEEMKAQLATMKELPNEIKKEIALYAQRDSRERIDQCCMKAAGFYESVKSLNRYLVQRHLQPISAALQAQFLRHFIRHLTQILSGLGSKAKQVATDEEGER